MTKTKRVSLFAFALGIYFGSAQVIMHTIEYYFKDQTARALVGAIFMFVCLVAVWLPELLKSVEED